MRAIRRHHDRRIKAYAKRVLRLMDVKEPTETMIGTMASTHCVPCSCFICQPDVGMKASDKRRFLATV